MYEKLIDECKTQINQNLISITKYGTEGQPNNILIVTKTLNFNDLEIIRPIIKKHKKNFGIVPVLMTHQGLQESTDVFPLEILDMKHPHTVLSGIDVIESLTVDKKHIRRQLEFELRSKLIHLRETYIWINKTREIKALLKSAIPTLMPLFYGMLYLKNLKPSTNLQSLFGEVHAAFDVDMSLFLNIKKGNLPKNELPNYIKQLMDLLERLISIIDKHEV
jgi:hypothetical protein|tara:strand:- start:7161 stop:7820 length:660 start_codon:yes stop_codon:yes gene_type:complete